MAGTTMVRTMKVMMKAYADDESDWVMMPMEPAMRPNDLWRRR